MTAGADITPRRRRQWPTVVVLTLLSVGVFVRPAWRAPEQTRAIASRPALAGTARPITWELLETLHVGTGVASDALTQATRRPVSLPGFLVPLDDAAESASEFLLVPYFGACIHSPPPLPNQMVYVTMVDGPVPFSMWEPRVIEGELAIAPMQSPYGKVSFVMTGRQLRPYTAPSTP